MANSRRAKKTTSNKSPKTPAIDVNPGLRALTLFETLPAGHVTFRVEDDGSDPHLQVGEYASSSTPPTANCSMASSILTSPTVDLASVQSCR